MPRCFNNLFLPLATICFFVSAEGQTGDGVFLKWKLQPNEVLTYETIMEEIDTTNQNSISFDFSRFSSISSDSSNSKSDDAEKFFKEINKSFEGSNLVTTLTEKKKGIIDIEMILEKKKDSQPVSEDTAGEETQVFAELLKMMTGNVMLRGSVYDNGAIQSFYIKNDQKNLISLFFELPNRKVKVGDTWALDVHLISMDQNFKCDTSYRRNKVTLLDIKKEGKDTIAVLRYDIIEFVSGDFKSPFSDSAEKTIMKMSFYGLAEFSIDKGRWTSYDGIMSLSSSGFMSSNTTKKLSLIVK